MPAAARVRNRKAAPLVERRFPLHLEPSLHTVRELYHAAKRARWDPEQHIPWKRFDANKFSREQLEAARLTWSRRAWTEYGGLPETPAILIRICLEHEGESDPKMFLTVRGTEQAWHLECAYRYADLCGGYLGAPGDPRFAEIYNQDLHRKAFDPQVQLDAYIGAHAAIQDGINLELCRGALRHASEPVALEILRRMVADKERHVAFGWVYLNERAGKWGEEERAEIAAEIEHVMRDIELRGYHCAWLAADGAGAEIVAADRISREAGFGALTPAEEREIVVRYLAEARGKLAGMNVAMGGFELPAAPS
jgi:hypothetical protein